MQRLTLTIGTLVFMMNFALAENRIDQIRPDAPELAKHGELAVGVQTLDLVNKNQLDIARFEEGKDIPRYDRPLTVEVFYPAVANSEVTPLKAFIRDGKTEVELHGKSSRDAEPEQSGAPYPLVIVSHGYPGNRFLMSHLLENLASKGYVVASIDHTDSTYRDKAAFGSTLVNRPFDQLFVLNEMERLGQDGDSFLGGLVDTNNTGLIGYSMGGYGALIVSGGGVTEASTKLPWGAPADTLRVHLAGSESHEKLFDDRIRAVIAIAPWGMERGFWDAEGLRNVRIPTLFVAGSQDDVAGYDKGVRLIWEQSLGAERYLLTFANANHNAAAPIPAPEESLAFNEELGFPPFEHYADAVWDTVRMNNILQHFATAFLAKYVKDDAGMDAYLDIIPDSNKAVWAVEEDGKEKPEHTYWKGFQNRTAKGLKLEKITPPTP